MDRWPVGWIDGWISEQYNNRVRRIYSIAKSMDIEARLLSGIELQIPLTSKDLGQVIQPTYVSVPSSVKWVNRNRYVS